MEEKEILIRHGEPNEYDMADFGSEIQIIGKTDYTLYRQVSKDSEKPKWELIGTYPIPEENYVEKKINQ